MNVVVLYLLLVKATLTSFSGLASLPMVRNDFVVRRGVLTDRQLNTAVAAGRIGPGPLGIYVVSVGYLADGVPGACAGWLAMITPAFLIIPMLRFLGTRAEHGRARAVAGPRRRRQSTVARHPGRKFPAHRHRARRFAVGHARRRAPRSNRVPVLIYSA